MSLGLILGVFVAVFTSAIYLVHLRRTFVDWRRYRDRRARRDFAAATALAVAALLTALSIILMVPKFGDVDTRRLFAGIAYGAFIAAGTIIVIADEP